MLFDSTTSGSTSLILRLRDNESLAWNQFVELYAPLVFHWCNECNLQSCDAADVMQDVFSKAARSISQFQSRRNGTLRGWLWTITQNQIKDFWRKKNREVNAAGGTDANLRFANLVDRIDQDRRRTDNRV